MLPVDLVQFVPLGDHVFRDGLATNRVLYRVLFEEKSERIETF